MIFSFVNWRTFFIWLLSGLIFVKSGAEIIYLINEIISAVPYYDINFLLGYALGSSLWIFVSLCSALLLAYFGYLQIYYE